MSSDENPPFQSIAIVGLGLIGGSIALAVRERWPSVRIVGVDRKAVLAHALGSGAIDRSADSVSDVGKPDLLVLSAPVRQNVQLLAAAARELQPEAIVTDVGGTKRDIMQAAAALPSGSPTFVGGHPIGGAERGGFGFARPDLFRAKPWIFTTDGSPRGDALERLSRFANGLGARPMTLDAERHDHLMAFLSHLPQLTASVLMDTVGRAVGAEGLRLAGRGLADTTRLASSPASVWRDICDSNAEAIGEALDALIARLSELRAGLQQGETVDAIFDQAARWRAELIERRD